MKEIFDAIDRTCVEPAKDMGDCRNRRIRIFANGDVVERYTRLGMRAGPHWAKVETNERAFFFSETANLGCTIAQRKDGTLTFIPPDRDIEDLGIITRYFIEKELMTKGR